MNAKPPLLLTGAGFTKNFGGFLSDEMFALIQSSVRRNRILLRLLKGTLDYEQVYGRVVIEGAEGGADERNTLLAAVQDAYQRLDDAVRRIVWRQGGAAVSHHHLREFIGKFAGRDHGQRGYFFTLNQDLFVERHIGIAAGDVLLHLHGQVRSPVGLHHNAGRDLNAEDHVVLEDDAASYRVADAQSSNRFHYVKLHGSLNWRSSRNRNVMVIGYGKEELIAREPLLAYYLETFERELYQTGRRLCVIGYGFRDPHINRRIANALQRHDLQLFAISPQPPGVFRDALRGPKGPRYGHVIWERVVHWPWTLEQIFPVGSSVPERSPWGSMIEQTLFGR